MKIFLPAIILVALSLSASAQESDSIGTTAFAAYASRVELTTATNSISTQFQTNVPPAACTSTRLQDTNAALVAKIVSTSNAIVALFPAVTNGVNGATGAQGVQGIQGIQGVAGVNATATTNAADLTTGTLPDARLRYVALGVSSNAVSATTATTALAGWPSQWPFASITNSPTTIAGYGITDFNSLGDARWSLTSHTHTFSNSTARPTTLAGYGITDALPTSGGTVTGAVTNQDIVLRHLTGSGALTIATNGGIGTNATVSITGNELGFYITAVVGTATIANSNLFTVTFPTVYSNAPIVFLEPAESNAVSLAVATQIMVRSNETSISNFSAKANTTALTVSKTYVWKGFVLGR